MYLGRERDLEVCVCVCVSGRGEDCVEILSRTLCMNLITWHILNSVGEHASVIPCITPHPPPPSPPLPLWPGPPLILLIWCVLEDKLIKQANETLFLKELLLQQAVVISRHGSRTLLTKDHKTFEEGMDSQLTIRGMNQMFRAGTFVQSHYQKDNFLTDVYSPPDIYVRSSDYSRTLNRWERNTWIHVHPGYFQWFIGWLKEKISLYLRVKGRHAHKCVMIAVRKSWRLLLDLKPQPKDHNIIMQRIAT